MGTSGTFGSFIDKACSHTMPETTSSLASTRVEASELMLGDSTCSGTILESYPNVNKIQCKKTCIARIQGYNGAFNTEQCGGYAFNMEATSGNVCKLYKAMPAILHSKQDDKSGWHCWNLTINHIKKAESTPRPPTAAELAAAEEKLPKLNIVLPDATSASILTYTSMDKNTSMTNTCQQHFQVITIQDAASQTASVKVTPSEWKRFVDMIPNAAPLPRRLASATGDVSSVVADRVVYGPSGFAPPMAEAPAVGKEAAGAPAAAAGAPTAGRVSEAPSCKPMPPASSMPISVILTNIVLGVAVFACGFGGFKGGQMAASHQVSDVKRAYQRLTVKEEVN